LRLSTSTLDTKSNRAFARSTTAGSPFDSGFASVACCAGPFGASGLIGGGGTITGGVASLGGRLSGG
jgi:hypothetical protein